MKKSNLLFLSLVIILSITFVYASSAPRKYTVEMCKNEYLNNDEGLFHCYSSVAMNENNIEICNLIKNETIYSYCMGITSKDPSYCEKAEGSKSNCYLLVSGFVKDPELCEKLDFPQNNEYYKEQCRNSMNRNSIKKITNETEEKPVLPQENKTKILPETASTIAQKRLGELGFEITLKEVGNSEEKKEVYILNGEKEGKMLGLFKVKGKINVEVDANSGEIIKIKKPWWAFLASGI